MLRVAASQVCRQAQRTSLAAAQRGFADQAVASKDPDWDLFRELVTSDEGRRELAALQNTYIDYRDRLENLSKAPKPVEWNKYKDAIDSQVLSVFQKAYESARSDMPKLDVSDLVKESQSSFVPLVKQSEELAAFSQKRIKEIHTEIEHLEDEKEKINKLTIDEELAADPALAKQIDEEIRQGNFMPN